MAIDRGNGSIPLAKLGKILITTSDADGQYIARCPQCNGCLIKRANKNMAVTGVIIHMRDRHGADDMSPVTVRDNSKDAR